MTKKRKQSEMFTRDEVIEERSDEDEIHAEDDLQILADNSGDVPIFADSDRRTLRSVAHLRIFKMEGGGLTYKGDAPIATTIRDIGQQYGDGIFAVEACNVKHRVLNRAENIRISLSAGASQVSNLGNAGASITELDRTERLATRASSDSMRLTEAFTTMVLSQSRESAERERAFMVSVAAQQNAGFQQMMTMLQTSHEHTLARLATLNADDKKQDPMVIVAMMMKAMEMGRSWAIPDGDDEDEDLPPWERAAKVLTDGAGLLVGVAKRQLSAPEAPSAHAAPASKKMTKEQALMVRQALQLSEAVRSSGLTMEQVLEKLRSTSATPVSAERLPDVADERVSDDGSDEQEDDTDAEDVEASADENDEFESDGDDSAEPAGVSEPN